MKKQFLVIVTFVLIAVTGFFFNESGAQDKPDEYFKRMKGYKAMMPIKVLRKIPLPKGYHEGLYVDGKNVWVNNGENGNTWVVDTDTEKVVSEIKPVGTFTEGITEVPFKKYWVSDWDTEKIYKVRIENNKMIPEIEVSFKRSQPAGIVWNEEYLYAITWTRGFGTMYHLLRMNASGKVLDKIRIRGIQEPSQITWDGKSLWISSWFQRRVYKINEKTLKIEGYFRTNIEKTTGVAWDGKYFWLTGTAADLYQVELLD